MTGEKIPELERVGQTSRNSIGGNQKGKRGKDMKTFKKVLASALAAAMVVTAFPVTNAEAATAPKLSATKATLYVKNFDYSESDTVLISEDAIYSRGNSYAGILQNCKLMYHSSLPKNTLVQLTDGNKYRNIGNRLFILDNNDGGK